MIPSGTYFETLKFIFNFKSYLSSKIRFNVRAKPLIPLRAMQGGLVYNVVWIYYIYSCDSCRSLASRDALFVFVRFVFLILITHPLIFARFNQLPHITWCKITIQFSHNNPRLRRYLTEDYFSQKETKQAGKSQLKSSTFSSFSFYKDEKRNPSCRVQWQWH